MNIIFQVQQFKEKSPPVFQFSLVEGLKTLWFNLKALFTFRLMVSNSDGWKKLVKSAENETIVDKSLMVNDEDKMIWIDTPKGQNEVALFIMQKLG